MLRSGARAGPAPIRGLSKAAAMEPHRRRQVSSLFAAALDRAPQGRAEFLDQACGADPDLRREVEALLLAHGEEETLGLTPAVLAAAHQGSTPRDGKEASLAPGSCLGPYQVVALLGAGGMGEVYRARDPRLRREVAVKVLSRHLLADQAQLRRFEHEARAAGALNHPNILAVFDIGAQDGVPYVVTELLEGETLRQRMQRGPLPLRECLDAARQLAAGLATAHDKGIVHRDLKPANLFLTRDGRMKILDFGLAKQTAAAEDSTLTAGDTLPGTVMGTVGYMSPEQVQGREVDHRSDLFSFGAVVYEMLAGSRAFVGASAVETMIAILSHEPPALQAEREVPAAVEQLVRRCLGKDRAARPQLSSELCVCLEDLAHAIESGAALPAAPLAAADAATPASASGSAPKGRHAVAVLPFVNLTCVPDQDYFCEGMADELTNALVRLEGLQVARLSVSRLNRISPSGASSSGLPTRWPGSTEMPSTCCRRSRASRAATPLPMRLSATRGLAAVTAMRRDGRSSSCMPPPGRATHPLGTLPWCTRDWVSATKLSHGSTRRSRSALACSPTSASIRRSICCAETPASTLSCGASGWPLPAARPCLPDRGRGHRPA
jgi:serine/threonine protein kinase